MKYLLLMMALLMAGCATKRGERVSYSAPSASGVAAPISEVRTSVTRASGRVSRIAKEGAAPGSSIIRELEQDLQEANLKAAQAEQGLQAYSLQVLAQTDSLNAAITDKNKALEEADYWHAKQVKALREIWMWRGLAALVVGSVLAFFGLRFAGKTLI